VNTDDELRASDAERTATADLLRRHHAEGRLDTAELEERIERCYAAKTRGDLAALTADLPGPPARAVEPASPTADTTAAAAAARADRLARDAGRHHRRTCPLALVAAGVLHVRSVQAASTPLLALRGQIMGG
jgi:hypothetical protein